MSAITKEKPGKAVKKSVKTAKVSKPTKTNGKANGTAHAKTGNRHKISCLDAAAKVLSTAKNPMNPVALIDEMAKRGLWKSENGKTPALTLTSAMIREIAKKGKASRFRKVGKGPYAAKN